MVFATIGRKNDVVVKPVGSLAFHFSMDVYKIYLSFRAWAGASFTVVASSGMETVDLDACSASEVGKPRPNDDRRGSAEMFVALLLLLSLDLCLPPPRSTCKWASRRSRLSKERAWLPGMMNLRSRRRFCGRPEGGWVSREISTVSLHSYASIGERCQEPRIHMSTVWEYLE
jgi:hypothetical protein